MTKIARVDPNGKIRILNQASAIFPGGFQWGYSTDSADNVLTGVERTLPMDDDYFDTNAPDIFGISTWTHLGDLETGRAGLAINQQGWYLIFQGVGVADQSGHRVSSPEDYVVSISMNGQIGNTGQLLMGTTFATGIEVGTQAYWDILGIQVAFVEDGGTGPRPLVIDIIQSTGETLLAGAFIFAIRLKDYTP